MSIIRNKAVARVDWIKAGLADCEELFNLGDYDGCAALATSVGDSAEIAEIDFDDTAELLHSAKNAEFEAYAFWAELADCAENLKCAAEGFYDDCVEYLEK